MECFDMSMLAISDVLVREHLSSVCVSEMR